MLVDEIAGRWRDEAYKVDSAAEIERAQTRGELEDALLRLPFIYRAVVKYSVDPVAAHGQPLAGRASDTSDRSHAARVRRPTSRSRQTGAAPRERERPRRQIF